MMQMWMNVRAITAAAAPMLSAVTRTVALRARVNQAMSATASTAQVHQLSVCQSVLVNNVLLIGLLEGLCLFDLCLIHSFCQLASIESVYSAFQPLPSYNKLQLSRVKLSSVDLDVCSIYVVSVCPRV